MTDSNPVSLPQSQGGAGLPDGQQPPGGYADWFDIMGGDLYNLADAELVDFNEQYKYQLGWIPNRVNTLTSGNYFGLKIYRCDDPNTLASIGKAGYFAVKFAKDVTYDYWIGYRANFANATPGAYVKWAYRTRPETDLIDWVTSTNDPKTGGHLDAPIPVGKTLFDGAISIKPTSVGQDTNGDQWIKVTVKIP